MFPKFSHYVAVLNRVGEKMASLGILLLAGSVTIDVIFRRLFSKPILFVDEIAGYLLVMVTFLGLAYTQKVGGHIQIELFFSRISLRKQAFLKLFWYGMAITFAILLMRMTGELTWESYKLKAFSPTPSQLLLFPFQIAMPIGCLFFLFQLGAEMIESVLFLFSSKRNTHDKGA